MGPRRLRVWLINVQSLAFGATVTLGLVMLFRVAGVLMPPGFWWPPDGVRFVSALLPDRPELPLPIRYSEFRALEQTFGADRVVPMVSERASVLAGGRQQEVPVVSVGPGFFQHSRVSLEGRAPVTHAGGGQECVVRRAVLNRLGRDDWQSIGLLRMSTGDCTVVGVVSDDLEYWHRGVEVVMSFSEQKTIRGLDHFNIVSALVAVRSEAEWSGVQTMLDGMSRDQPIRLATFPVWDVLFQQQEVRAARSAAISGVGVVLLVGVLLVALGTADATLRIRELTLHAVIGAAGLVAWRRIAGRRLRESGWGAVGSAVLCIVAMTGLAGTDIRSAGILAVMTGLLSWMVFGAVTASVDLVLIRRLRHGSTSVRSVERWQSVGWTVTAAVCISAGALVSVGLSYRTAYAGLTEDALGMDLAHLSSVSVATAARRDWAASAEALAGLDRVFKIGIDGGADVTFSLVNPIGDASPGVSFTIDSTRRFLSNSKEPLPGRQVVGPRFAELVGARVLEGRDLTWDDGPAARRVAIVNEQMARTFWKDRSPIGARLTFRIPNDPAEEPAEVVGVISDVQHGGYRAATRPEVYLSVLHERMPTSLLHVIVRHNAASAPVLDANVVSGLLGQVDQTLRLTQNVSLARAAEAPVKALKEVAFTALFVQACAVFVTVIVVVLLTSSWVADRSHAFGIRQAIGGSRLRVVIAEARGLLKVAVLIATGVGAAGYMAMQLVQATDSDIVSTTAAGGAVALGSCVGLAFLAIGIVLIARQCTVPIAHLIRTQR